MHTLALVAVLALAGSLSAQKASYTFFGTGCTKKNWVPVKFTVTGTPKLGGSFTVHTNPAPINGYRAFLLTGDSKTWFGNTRLPFDLSKLSGFGQNFCGKLNVSVLVMTKVPVRGDLKIAVPRNTSLQGVSFYQQVLLAGAGFGLWYWTSRAGHGVIGR